ncbi:MAG: pyridoxal-phosphate dependent enzyme, partial [Mesorhizobium sp.]
MFLLNHHPSHRQPLTEQDAATLGLAGAADAERFLAARDNHAETPLHALPALAGELGVGSLYVKDEGKRLGLGSFKALGGAYAVIRLVLEEAGKRLGRAIDVAELHGPDVKAIASGMTFACATDGNHGRSIAQGAGLVGARSVIFVHSGVSNERVAAIARFGAEIVRIAGDYDQSVREAARV